MAARHPDSRDKVVLDQGICEITELGGKEFGSYEAEEEFYLSAVEGTDLTRRELNWLLHNSTERQ